MNLSAHIIIIAAVIAGTVFTRSIAFLCFPANKRIPSYIKYLGEMLPSAVIAMLIVYCLKDMSLLTGTHGIPEIASVVLVIFLHRRFHQMLLSISGGTAMYMLLNALII